MKDQKNLVMTAMAILALSLSANSTASDLSPDIAPQSTIKMCVAEISDFADYTAATRVRHEVDSEKRRTIGHVLRIETLVYGDADGRLLHKYVSKCVVGNGVEPVRFEIKETQRHS